jgi:hypothetical protein
LRGEIILEYEVRKALMEDTESLGNIIVESWKAAYSNIIPEDEMAKFLDKERRKRQFERFIENGEIILIGIYNNG